MAVDRLQGLIDLKLQERDSSSPLSLEDKPHKLKSEPESTFHRLFMRKPESVISAMGCEACWIVGQVVDNLVQYNTFTNLVETAAIGICNQELDFWVCRGFVNSLAPIIIQNLEALITTPQYICTEFVSACQ